MGAATCLCCDLPTVINIYSQGGQKVAVCAKHWLEFSRSADNLVKDEALKYFQDGKPDDQLMRVDEILRENGISWATDEEPGEYRTGER